MAWWIARTAGAVAIVALAAGCAALIGFWLHLTWAALLVGGLGAMAALVMRDSWRGMALLQWLREPLSSQAPRDRGFWGEVGYLAEKALRAREVQVYQEQQRLEQFLSAIEASPNGVMMLDAGDQIEWCNSVAAEHFGIDPRRDRRQRVTNLVRTPAFVALLQQQRFDETVVFPGPLGRTTLSVLVRPYGEGMKLVLSQDITERERIEAMRRDFVANVSHEIRTPLTVLSGFVETLASLPLTAVERKRVLQLMGQQTDRMQALVGDLLTLAKLEGSPRPLTDQWLAVGSLLERARADALALSSGRHRVQLEGLTDTDLAEIAGAETEIYSAVVNLLNNAVRYTPDGGLIQLQWRWRSDGGAEIVVSDSGIGIAREHLTRLTERFYRVDGSRSRDTGGTGLGLSIVKHVVQRHGGEMQIQSEPGRGSMFSLIFPVARVRRRDSALPLPRLAAAG